MKVETVPLPGVLRLQPDVYKDGRGYFIETYRSAHMAEHGIPAFAQDNVSVSVKGVLRGLHLQHPHGQAKLVYTLSGEVYDVCVDVRVGSPTFGQWYGEILSAEQANQLYIPSGFAHGFCVLSDTAIFAYKCSDVYCPETQLGILWNDPAVGIPWPVANPTVSPKDAVAPLLSELTERLPRYDP